MNGLLNNGVGVDTRIKAPFLVIVQRFYLYGGYSTIAWG
jgi:hypothetical protein